VADMETRLKDDVLAEAATYNNNILVTLEEGNGIYLDFFFRADSPGKLTEMKEITLQDRWQPLHEIKSPFEMYVHLSFSCTM
jgi:hypothetical protein